MNSDLPQGRKNLARPAEQLQSPPPRIIKMLCRFRVDSVELARPWQRHHTHGARASGALAIVGGEIMGERR
jgi:hypothetical protein